jgi:hypothetical protein
MFIPFEMYLIRNATPAQLPLFKCCGRRDWQSKSPPKRGFAKFVDESVSCLCAVRWGLEAQFFPPVHFGRWEEPWWTALPVREPSGAQLPG